MIRNVLVAASAALLVSACAGRTAVPVAQVQPYDSQLSCEQIIAEQQDINTKVSGLQKEKDSARDANVAIGAVGALLFWPALFALDTGDAEDVEMRAYQNRSQHLSMVAGQKGCFAGTPVQAVSAPAAAPSQAASTAASISAPAPRPIEATSETAPTSVGRDDDVVCDLEGVIQPRTRGYCVDNGGRVVSS